MARPQAALLSDRDLVKTILLFRDFQAPEGVSFSFEVAPEQGGCRVHARLAERVFPLVHAADDEFMRSLHVVAKDMAINNRLFSIAVSCMGKDM